MSFLPLLQGLKCTNLKLYAESYGKLIVRRIVRRFVRDIVRVDVLFSHAPIQRFGLPSDLQQIEHRFVQEIVQV
jgi:hypothetical protein